MIYRIAKYPFFGKFMVKWRSPINDGERKNWENISIKSKSGAILKGLFARSRTNETKATIVLGHPMGKEAKGFFIKRGYTDLLRENGFNTLVFDINGFGESSNGNFSYFEDIIAIGIEAQKLTPDLPIGYHGISLGGQWATIAFADESHTFKFAIVESAATTLKEFWVSFPFAHAFLTGLSLLLPKLTKKVNMIERIKEAKNLNSLLLIYSETDKWISVEMGMRFKTNSPVATELWTVKNADHAEIMKSEHKEEYELKILNYFNREVEKIASAVNPSTSVGQS